MKQALILLIVSLLATPALADSTDTDREKDRKFFNFGTTSSDTGTNQTGHKNCRAPKKPDLLNELPFLEKQLIYAIYAHEVANPILSTKTCSCDMLYPSYDHTIDVYKRDFVPMGLPVKPGSDNESTIVKYINEGTPLYNKAVNVCINLGVG